MKHFGPNLGLASLPIFIQTTPQNVRALHDLLRALKVEETSTEHRPPGTVRPQFGFLALSHEEGDRQDQPVAT